MSRALLVLIGHLMRKLGGVMSKSHHKTVIAGMLNNIKFGSDNMNFFPMHDTFLQSLIGSIYDRIFILTNQQVVLIGLIHFIRVHDQQSSLK